MKFLILFLLFLSSAKADFYSHDDIARLKEDHNDYYRRVLATLFDKSYNCSVTCLITTEENFDERTIDKSSDSEFLPVLAVHCNIVKNTQQCLGDCPDGAMKTVITTLAEPFKILCSDRFEAVVIQNFLCLKKFEELFSKCFETNCKAYKGPKELNILKNIPQFVKSDGDKLCGYAKCLATCGREAFTEANCKSNAVEMLHEVITQIMRTAVEVFEQAGVEKDNIPNVCKQLAKSPDFGKR